MGKRRGHHEDSYRQRKDGLWEVRTSLPNGKRKSFYGKTREEARNKLRQAQRDAENGLDLSARSQTVAQYLRRWLEDVARPTLRPSTYESYRGHVENHLIPALGYLKLTELTPQHVQRLMNEKAAGGLAPRTVAYMRAVLRRALGQALAWGLVTRNVATLASPPRLKQKPVQPLTPEQARAFLDFTKDDRLGPLFHVAIATGLRQGELLGLRWKDVDLETGTLTVRFALQRVDKELRFVEPKTERSRRTINLPASAVAALRTQSVRQKESRLLAGSRWQGDAWGLVFTSTIGTPLNPSNVTHRLQQVLNDAGLPRQRFHDLRHCCASLMLAQNVPARVVMETLGHSQISLTMNTYSHVMPTMQREAADLLDALLTDAKTG